MTKQILLLIIISIFSSTIALSQRGKNETLVTSVEYNTDGTATISWPEDASFDGNYHIYENQSDNTTDFKYKTYVGSTVNSWTDMEYKSGEVKEYLINKFSNENKILSWNLVSLGTEVNIPNKKDGVLILIDEEYEFELENELIQLRKDLEKEGWGATVFPIPRDKTPAEVKESILLINKNWEHKLTALYLIGHIPVPYSGFFGLSGHASAPDGHNENGSNPHTGAWPADMYYGDLDGIWTDASVNYEQSAQERNNNRPGDNKFDQTFLPSDIELQVGRVDFYNMPIFDKTELELLKDYLNRAHLWRTGQINIINRGLVDDNFKGHIISNSAYKSIGTILGTDSLFDDRDYMTELVESNYLLSFGNGAGSYSSCSGIGTSADLAENNIQTIFTGLSGSYFGDWDSKNNFLRSAIASGALASFWSGIPNWYLQPMASGKTIGYCARYSMNANISSFNGAHRKIHVALMGDPTLTLRPLVPANEITATETMQGIVLNWEVSQGDFDGYNIYRLSVDGSESVKVNNEIIIENSYVDISAPTGKFVYQLRTVKLENLANNSYFTLGHSATSNEVNFISSVEFNLNDEFSITPNPSTGTFRLSLPSEAKLIESVVIQDLTGRVVYQLFGDFGSEKTYDTALPTGTYMLITNTNKGQFVEKIQILK